MKKNWKCIVGATLLTPICMCLFLALGSGLTWLVKNVVILQWIVLVGTALILLIFIWCVLFYHCKDHWDKKSNNPSQPTRSD